MQARIVVVEDWEGGISSLSNSSGCLHCANGHGLWPLNWLPVNSHDIRQILLLILLSASTSTCHIEQLFNIKAAYICLNEWLIDKLDCLTHCVYILCAPTLPTIIRKLKQATSLSQTIAVGVWPLKSRSSLSSSTCTSVQMTSVLETSWVTHHATSHELQLRTYFCTCKLS